MRPLPRQKKTSSPRNVAAQQSDHERVVELSIRGAELVRILAALSEEVEDVANNVEDESLRQTASALAHGLSEAVLLGARYTQATASEAVHRFRGAECLPTRCAILSSRDAQRIAKRFFWDQRLTGT